MRTIIIISIVLLVLIGVVFGSFYFVNKGVEEVSDGVESSSNCIDLGCGDDTIYVGSKNSDKYYLCKCGWAKNIKPENVLCFESENEAELDGYVKSEC
jgi:hypothetical protein